jgi:two-component system NtrC family response regulator
MTRVLESMNGNKTRAAKKLGVSRKTLERKIKAWSRES